MNSHRVLYTSRTFAHDHPDIVAEFTRASIRGWRDDMNDPTVANAMIEKLNSALNPDWANYSYNALKTGHNVTGYDPSGADTGQFDPARWTTLYKQLLDLHVIQKPLDPSTAYSLQFMK
jgi:NitT/TauT family transport system substrate-binding protein